MEAPRVKHVYTDELHAKLLALITEKKISIASASKELGYPDWLPAQHATLEQREELKNARAPKSANIITPDIVERIKALLTSGHDLMQACNLVGIKYHIVMYHTTKAERRTWGVVPRGTTGRPVIFDEQKIARATVPQKPVPNVVIKAEQQRENNLSFFNGIPHNVQRIHKSFIGQPIAHQGRFFIRIEAEVYWVVGYEYPVPNDPLRYQVDCNLHDYNTDPHTAITNIREKLKTFLETEVTCEVHGKVRYSVNPPKPYNKRTLQTKTSLNVPDGEYRCNLARDLGHIEHKGMPYQFVIDGTVDRMQNVPMVVKNKVGTIYL